MISWKIGFGLYQLEPYTASVVAKESATGNRNIHPCVADLTIGPISGKVNAYPKPK